MSLNRRNREDRASQPSPVACAVFPNNPATSFTGLVVDHTTNDPSAGSPTETLLRLILPLSDKVYETSRFHNIAV